MFELMKDNFMCQSSYATLEQCRQSSQAGIYHCFNFGHVPSLAQALKYNPN